VAPDQWAQSAGDGPNCEAVITDKRWIQGLGKIASPLLPGIELRTFAPGGRAEAMAWAADI
jgi:hypothetical protein